MPEVRRPITPGGDWAALERRLRAVEAVASRPPTGALTVEFANQVVVENSGSFSTVAHTEPLVVLNPVIVARFVVQADAATTGQFRMREGRSGRVTDSVSVTNDQRFVAFEWLHEVDLADDWAHFEIQARRSSGSGDVWVWSPRRWETASITRVPTAATDGNPRLLL